MNKTGDLRIDKIMPRIKDSWLKLPFENCLNEKTGGYKKLKKNDLRKSGKIPVVDQGERFITGYTNDESNLYQGGLPVVIFGDHTRRIKYIDFDFAVGADGTKLLHPFEALSPKFFYHYLKALSLDSQGYSRHYRFLKQIEVPIPPIIEQHRIVAKLEKLLAKVDKCKERLGKIPAILKRFRQSVLAAACSGEHTADWRERNLNIESAEILLNKIQSQREERYKKECLKAKREGGKKSLKGYEITIYDNDTGISSWAKVKLENLIYIAGRIGWRGLKAEEYTKEGSLFLSVHCLNYGEVVDFQDALYISMERYNESPEIQLRENDILLAKDGAGIGKIGIIKNLNHLATVNSSLLVIRSLEAFIPKFLLYFLSGPELQNLAKQRITGSATPHLFQKDIKQFLLAVPPIEEQKEIVSRVEALFKIADEIEARYVKATAHVDKLTQSILAKAFRGELVPQDPNDEPASDLLKRIRAERERTEKSKVQKTPKSYRKRKEAIQASDKIRKPQNIEKPERKGLAPVLDEKEAITQKTKRKSPKAPTRQPLPLVDLDQQTIMAAFRIACRNRGEISRENLLKEVASNFGYQRLSTKLRVKLQGDMRAAMMRGIILSNGDIIVTATRNVEDYDRDDLIKYACSVTKKGKLYEQDTVIRDTLKHLGFQRITEQMRSAVASAIRSGIRNGLFVRDKGMIFRP